MTPGLVHRPLQWRRKEVDRRSHVIGIFANQTAMLQLVQFGLADQHDEWQGSRRDINPWLIEAAADRHIRNI